MIYLAGGNSRRFGSNKLMESLDGKPMYRHLLDRLIRISEKREEWNLTVVTQYPEIEKELQEEPVRVRFCSESRMGASFSVKAGLEDLTDEEACVFFRGGSAVFPGRNSGRIPYGNGGKTGPARLRGFWRADGKSGLVWQRVF